MTESDFKKIALFKDCKLAFLNTLEVSARHQVLAKGKMIFIHGEYAERFYFIKNGWVKFFRETAEGVQSVVDILSSGQIFGETAIFENDVYPYSAEVVEAAEILSFPLSCLKTEIETNNKFALNMLESMALYRRHQEKELEHRSIQNAPQRIGCFLLRLVNQDEIGAVTVHLPYDKTLVASRLGMQPETFSRALAKLSDQTNIRIKGAMIEMDNLDQLRNYSCSACSSEFPCKDLEAAE